MRCKKHYTDLSSSVGVCACCLRERLLYLIAAEEQLLAQAQAQNLDGKHRNREKNPVFPHSEINSRKSDLPAVWSQNNRRKDDHPYPPAAPRHHHSLSDQLFYRTPTTGGHSNKKRSFIRLLSFPIFFRSRNRNSVDSVSESDATCGGGNATSTSSSSWFSSIIYGGRHRRKQPVNVSVAVVRRQQCGMSPVRNSDAVGGDEDESYDAASGYESTESRKQRTPAHPHVRRGGHVRNLSFCLSPLVRASPNRQWNQPDGGLSCEIRALVKPHLSNTKSFCANRSRKLAHFGRPNPNR